MKMKYTLILFFLFPILGFAQQFIQGKDIIPFASIASSNYLLPSNRLTIDNAHSKLLEFRGSDSGVKKDKMLGEYFFVNGFLVSTICEPLNTLKEKKYPGINSTYLYLKQDYDPNTQYLSYENKGNIKILIFYINKLTELHFFIENDKHSIMGSVSCKSVQKNEAQNFITTLTSTIKFN